tara:strand:+ start:4398 stop:4574 length:177 start_codon:yes stop_codon:yes gene_type:complete
MQTGALIETSKFEAAEPTADSARAATQALDDADSPDQHKGVSRGQRFLQMQAHKQIEK